MDSRSRTGWSPGDEPPAHARSEVAADSRADRPGDPVTWPDRDVALGWLPVASLVLAGDGSVVAVNGAWTALSKLSPAESMGGGWLKVVEALDRTALHARLRLAATVGESGSADCHLVAVGGLRRSRWWWQPGPGRELVVCVADIGGYADGPDAWMLPADSHLNAAAVARGGISRDLATTVIHRIFGAALILESAASLSQGHAASRLQRAVAELDALIRDIRIAVIEPFTSPGPAPHAPPESRRLEPPQSAPIATADDL